MKQNYFVTGTDTNVGKTQITCLIAIQAKLSGLRVAAYKPVCSGAVISARENGQPPTNQSIRWDDIERLRSAVGREWSDDLICPQRFLAPLAPPVAARLEGRVVDFETIMAGSTRFHTADLLLIEGAGGWLSPLTETRTVADLAMELNYPVLIVGRTGLGTINHTLMTVECVKSRGLTIAGIILNQATDDDLDLSSQTNADEIETRSGIPVLGTVLHGSDAELECHGQTVEINWLNLASGLT